MGNSYQKAGGSAGSKGVNFQVNLLSIFLLNALRQNIRDWKLSTENKLAKKFDDVVLELSDGRAILLQAKHKENKKVTLGQLLSPNSKNEDFSLPKYFISYLEVRTKFPVKLIVICTNTRADPKILEFLDQSSVCRESMLHYEDGTPFFTFNDGILSDLITNAKAYHKNNLKGTGFDETLITEDNAKEFLKHLQLYLDYPSGSDLEKAGEKLLTGLKSPGNLLRNISYRDIYQKVKDWFEQPQGEYLTENRAKAMFCEIKSDKYRESLEDQKVFFKNNDLQIRRERILHVVAEGGQLLHLMRAYRSLRDSGTKMLYAVPDDGRDVQELMIKAFELPVYTCLIIVSPKFTEESTLSEICCKLKDILQSREYKKVIFVAEPDNKLALMMTSGKSDYDTFDKPLTLEDLSEDTQERLLRERSVVFQGEDVSLAELLLEQASFIRKISAKSGILDKLVRGEKITVGAPVMDLEEKVSRYYLNRKFERTTDEARNENYRTREKEEATFCEEDIYDVEEKTIIISDSAGTGKTTVLKNLAAKIKKNNPRLWVVRIELNECTKALKESLTSGGPVNVWELLNWNKSTNDLESTLFSLKGMVVLMFDAVDEISPDYTEVILDILARSQEVENVAKIFVTTRPHMAPVLEKRMNVTSFALTPLTVEDTVGFLTGYWTYNMKLECGSSKKCTQYAESLLRKVAFLMWGWQEVKENRFVTFPLYLRMLAEVFLENKAPEEWDGCREFLNSDDAEPKLPQRVNIARLYEMFIEKKRDIFMDKGNPSGNATANRALMDQYEECLTHHRSLALKAVLDKVTCALFSCQPHDTTDKQTKMLKMGIVQKLNGHLCFVHRTFAEYFVAQALLREMQLSNKDARFQRFLIHDVFLDLKFNNVRYFLDNLLAPAIPSLRPEIFESYTSYFGFNNPHLIHQLAYEGYTEIIRLVLKSLNYDALKRPGNVLQDKLQSEGIDMRDAKDRTPLHWAVRGGNLDTVKFFVNTGADVNGDTEFVGTPLHLSVLRGEACLADFLLESGADVNKTTKGGRTALHVALDFGRLDMLYLLLSHGADFSIADAQGRTALHLAVGSAGNEAFDYLAERGMDVNARTEDGRTPLHFAARHCNCYILESLLRRGVDINTADGRGSTVLHYTIENRNNKLCEFLLERGADANVVDGEGYTALHFAVTQENYYAVESLLEHGADINNAGKGATALHLAAERGRRDIVELLVKHHADVNIADGEGNTALHVAAKCGKLGVVEFLTDLGVDINLANREGRAALHVALLHGRWGIVELLVRHKADILAAEGDDRNILEFLVRHGVNVGSAGRGRCSTLHLALLNGRWDIVESLAKHRVDINIADDRGRTALHFAAEGASCDILAFLVEHGADLNYADKEGRTALHLALLSGRWEVVECLVKRGADVDAADERGSTALHLAVESGSCDTVAFLVDRNADVNIADKEGRSALQLATSRDRWDIVKYLLEQGADSNTED